MNKPSIHLTVLTASLMFFACGEPNNKEKMDNATVEQTKTEAPKETTLSNREKAVALLESLETGDHEPISYVNPEKYIQHNLSVGDGLAGFGEVMKNAPEGGFKAKVIRSFEDGDFVFTHSEYDFFGPKIGFDVFRFEDGKIVEHWDNLTAITPPNASGRTQIDGPTEVDTNADTEKNRAIVDGFLSEILINGNTQKVTEYVSTEKYHQHNSSVADGLDGLSDALKYFADNDLVFKYDKVHKILAQGDFVLAMSEGKFGKGDHVAYYDLFRLENGLITEHWDVIENIPATSEWKNENGKF